MSERYKDQAKQLNTLAAEEGLIALIAGPNVLRFAPSLIIPGADVEEGLNRLERAVARLCV
jgi:succinylornithine aminotransferase